MQLALARPHAPFALAGSPTAAVPSCCAGRSASLDVELLVVDIELSDTSDYEVDEMAPEPRHGRLDGAGLGLISVAPARSGMFSWASRPKARESGCCWSACSLCVVFPVQSVQRSR